MSSEMSGDELERIGDLGEIEFQRLCRLAKLHCSKVLPDRTGKDFVVEFPLAPLAQGLSFDKSPPPSQVIVQVKTILEKTTSARLTLSVANRLAKDTRPAVVAIFRIDENDLFKSLDFVHIIDSDLARVLKSLRKASKKKYPKLHEMTISFAPHQSKKVPMEALGLYAAVSSLSGSDMLKYAAEKTKQLNELGFAADRFNMKFSVDATEDEITDGFLALGPLAIQNLVVTERRFDIDMPIQGIPKATMEFEPISQFLGEVVMTCKQDGTRERITIPAQIRFVPESMLGQGKSAVRAVTKLGEFIVKPRKWSYKHPNDFGGEDQHTLEEWTDYLDLRRMIGSGRISMELTGQGETGSLRYKITDSTIAFDTDPEARYLRLLKKVKAIGEASRFTPGTFSLEDVRRIADHIALVAASIEKPIYQFRCELTGGGFPLFDNEPAAFVSAVKIAERWIGFILPMSVTATHGNGGILCAGAQTKRALIEELNDRSVEEDFEAFGAKYCELMDLQLAFIQNPGDFLGPTTILEDMRDRNTRAL
ncbi:hypothetical protein [Rhizobium rhizogenes]|uniref:hypothetical protein n=1 Tax=Rhizobium rhizogenes TaxID=359 RepID=UPI0022C7CBCF|nr:hypothetical protein [Rhizobium rhizogenes]MCZ7454389.1 hypothetical protein [Rhizobium rhizogenes]